MQIAAQQSFKVCEFCFNDDLINVLGKLELDLDFCKVRFIRFISRKRGVHPQYAQLPLLGLIHAVRLSYKMKNSASSDQQIEGSQKD